MKKKEQIIIALGIPIIVIGIIAIIINTLAIREINSKLNSYTGTFLNSSSLKGIELDEIIRYFDDPETEEHTIRDFPENQWYSDTVLSVYSKNPENNDIKIKECSWVLVEGEIKSVLTAYCHYKNKKWVVFNAIWWIRGKGKHWIEDRGKIQISPYKNYNALLANSESVEKSIRCDAIFWLFNNIVKPGMNSEEISKALQNPTWLNQTEIGQIFYLAGWIPIQLDPKCSIYAMHLFLDGEGSTDRSIYFSLSTPAIIDLNELGEDAKDYVSGKFEKHDQFVHEFMKGKNKDKDIRIVEYALCYPDGRIINYSVEGKKLITKRGGFPPSDSKKPMENKK